jgi:hypothetical protein
MKLETLRELPDKKPYPFCQWSDGETTCGYLAAYVVVEDLTLLCNDHASYTMEKCFTEECLNKGEYTRFDGDDQWYCGDHDGDAIEALYEPPGL